MSDIIIRPIANAADKKAFIELGYRLNANDPAFVPPLKGEVNSLITPGKNPFWEHAEGQLYIAERGGRVVGRISAHIDLLALQQPPEKGFGPGKGSWGLFEAEDEEVAAKLIAAAEDWLRSKDMTHAVGPISLSIWEEPGLLIQGHDEPPTVMMGHDNPIYEGWIERQGYAGVQDLYTYAVPIKDGFPELVNRIVAMGDKNERINIRRVDKSKFDEEAAIIIHILNDAWSDNWGFIPFTESEIAYAGKAMKPLVHEDLIRIAEVDGEPVAFMMVLPDLNEPLKGYGGSLLPFNWVKLLWWLRKPKSKRMRVPLMGVVQKLQSTRMASQLAMMLIEYIRRDAVGKFGVHWGEFGWVLASNGPMRSVGEAVGGSVNKIYRIYEKAL